MEHRTSPDRCQHFCSRMRQKWWYDVAMPHVDPLAKAFEEDFAVLFAGALSQRRRALGLTASELSRRTRNIGYPISRGAIAKMESNSRSGKIDVMELLVLAAALDIPPVLLLFPEYPDGRYMALLPNVVVQGHQAVDWIAGVAAFPSARSESGEYTNEGVAESNEGIRLVAATRSLDRALGDQMGVMARLAEARSGSEAAEVEVNEQMLRLTEARIKRLRSEIDQARKNLWGVQPSPGAGEDDERD